MDREYLKNKGWRRHSVISHNNDGIAVICEMLPENIQTLLAQEGAIAIISTYDCAVVSTDFDGEPWVQLLVAFPTKLNKGFVSCRHPRRLHVLINIDSEKHNFEVNAVGICQIERRVLLDFEPSNEFKLPKITKEHLNYWIAERFRQETWPDAFNASLRSAERRLKRFYNRYNQFVPAMYIRLNRYDELKYEKYEISIILSVEVGCLRALLNEMRKRHAGLRGKSIDEVYNYIASDVTRAFGDTVKFIPDPTKSNN
ncbi:MAG: hypothetical protein DRQ47_06795, partial [Gammaproteobacteria bacterium]